MVLYFSRMDRELPFARLKLNTPPRVHHCERTWEWKPRPLPDYDLWIVLGGLGKLELNGQTYAVGAGKGFVLAPGSRLYGRHDPDHRLVVFAVHFEPLDARGRFRPLGEAFLSPPATSLRDLGLLTALAHRAEDCHQRGDALGRHAAEQCVRLMLLELIDAARNPPSPADTRVGEVISAIRRDPGPPRFVGAMARQAHLSPSQFTRRFRALTGMSPAKFMIHARLDRARQLLLETDLTVKQIADALGYSDIYFFSRQYKQVFGSAPSSARAGRCG